jgi:hypothetical protein
MLFWYGAMLGLVFGGIIGVVTMACIVANGRGDNSGED